MASGSASTPDSAERILEQCRLHEGSGLRTFIDESPVVWDRAQGCRIWDVSGKEYLDLFAGYSVASVGHQHPRVVEAIRAQAGRLSHCPSSNPSATRARFGAALIGIAPEGLTRFLPAMHGGMAIEIAVAIARRLRGGGEVVSFGGYFGRTAGSVPYGGRAHYRAALGLAPGAHFLPYPNPMTLGNDATSKVLEMLDLLMRPGGGYGKLAAVILEPIQGNSGVVIPADDFLPRLREVCDRSGALLIVDEIQSGFGRTGRTWATEHSGVIPDLMCVGKGLGGGLAMAALLGREVAMRSLPHDSYSTTLLTNAVNLAAATASIEVLTEEALAGRAARLGPRNLQRLRRRLDGVAGVREVRGRGLWYGIEIEEDDSGSGGARVGAVVARAREAGVLVGRGGAGGNVIRINPPLVIDEAELRRGLDVIEACLRETA